MRPQRNKAFKRKRKRTNTRPFSPPSGPGSATTMTVAAANTFMLYMAAAGAAAGTPFIISTTWNTSTTPVSLGVGVAMASSSITALRVPHTAPLPMSSSSSSNGNGNSGFYSSTAATSSRDYAGARIPRMNRSRNDNGNGNGTERMSKSSASKTTIKRHEVKTTNTSVDNEHIDLDTDNDENNNDHREQEQEHLYLPQSPLVPDDAHLEIAGHTLGNFHRSPTSSDSFFKKVDRDGDGKIRRPELAHFLQHNIGGSAFDDENNEISPGVDSILKKLDLDGNDGLDYRREVSSYWETLDRLLTVEDVADWVVHAVQLPATIGTIFREHHVTGYDFPELVDNDGKALEEELNIQSKQFRKKIMRLVQARMLGIGNVPDKPSNLKVVVEGDSCVAMKIMWDKSRAEGFPVHKYRVMRRNVGGGGSSSSTSSSGSSSSGNKTSSSAGTSNEKVHNGHDRQTESEMCALNKMSDTGIDNNEDSAMCNDEEMQAFAMAPVQQQQQQQPYPDLTSNTNPLVSMHGTEWRTVCETTQSDETECIDSNKGLERGQNYIYRIQAWSAAGSSHWAVLDPSKEWMEYGCDGNMINENGTFVEEQVISNKSRTNQNRSITTEGDERTVKSKRPMALFIVLRRIIDVITFIVKFVSAVLTTGSLLLRFQRVGPTSTSMAGRDMDQPFFPWLLEQVNDTSKKYVGFRVIPESLILHCEEDAVRHDTMVKRVGLNGYRQAPSMRDLKLDRETSTRRAGRDNNNHMVRVPPQGLLKMSRSRSAPSESEDITTRGDQHQRRDASNPMGYKVSKGTNTFAEEIQTPQQTKKNKPNRDGERSRPFKMVRSQKKTKDSRKVLSPSTDRPLRQQQPILPIPPTNSEEVPPNADHVCMEINQNVDGVTTSTVSTPITTPKSRTRKFFRRKKVDDSKESSLSRNYSNSQAHTSTPRKNLVSPAMRRQIMHDDCEYPLECSNSPLSFDVENHTLCNTCGKKYKFPKRCRHHCSRCGDTFCHKHGRCTHSNFVSCKVPGDCVCNRCLLQQ